MAQKRKSTAPRNTRRSSSRKGRPPKIKVIPYLVAAAFSMLCLCITMADYVNPFSLFPTWDQIFTTVERIGGQDISPKIREDALSGRSILSSDRETLMDYWVSYVAYFYDLNFRESLDIVEENDFVRRIIRRIPYSNPATREAMEELEKRLLKYVHER